VGLRTATAAVFLGLALLGAGAVPAESCDAVRAEAEIKAAFVFNFAKFVQWPESAFSRPQSPILLCLIGNDGSDAAFAAVDHKIAQGREVQVRRQVRLEDARSCHILYIAETERARLAPALQAVAGASVLTISDADRFAENGGVIGLYRLDDRMQFAVNLERARGASLQISSQLLKLARIVPQDAREEKP
jgi:hypothetical protein